jgi:hypothetical protein
MIEGKLLMSNRRVVVGQSEWRLPDGDVSGLLEAIETAMQKNEAVKLALLDTVGRPVTVFLNCQAAQTVVIDLEGGPRPTEYSG